MTRTNLPVSDYAANPYVGCSHACKSGGSREYWTALDREIRAYAAQQGMPYVRDDDRHRSPFGEPPVICNYFYHEEITKSAKKARSAQAL